MKRRLVNLWIAASLTLAVLTAGLWVRSYWVIDWVTLSARTFRSEFFSHAGSISCTHRTFDWSSDVGVKWLRGHRSPGNGSFTFTFAVGRFHNGRYITFPQWLPVLLLSAPPGAVLAGRWRPFGKLRTGGDTRAGRDGAAVPCPDCGYDTRATPGRCPECGAVDGERAALGLRPSALAPARPLPGGRGGG